VPLKKWVNMPISPNGKGWWAFAHTSHGGETPMQTVLQGAQSGIVIPCSFVEHLLQQ
jgi:hypothetical protein